MRQQLASFTLLIALTACGGGSGPTASDTATPPATVLQVQAMPSAIESSTTASPVAAKAVDLTDAIAILKMIVGLDVNTGGAPLTAYQAYAADVDGNGKVELSDAISVLKRIVGLETATANWMFFNGTPTVNDKLNPGVPASVSAAVSSNTNVSMTAVLRGDVVSSSAYTYSWALTSKPSGSTATLASTTAANPSFKADVAGAYVATMTITDGSSNVATSSVTLTACSASSNSSSPFSGCTGSSGSGSTTSTKSLSANTQAQLDTLIGTFMTAHAITAGSITVMSGADVLYNKSYGYQDQNSTTLIVSDPLMVTASIVKPLTAATVQYLARIGAFNLSDHVFCTGANTPCWLNVVDPAGAMVSGFAAGGFVDTRYANITIQQLLDHEGGWNRGLKTCANEAAYDALTTPCDPMVQERLIQATLHAAFPANFTSSQLPTQMNDIYYWVTRNTLDHAPGTTQVYSNFGYMILTAIVARVTGSDYNTYVYNTILSPLAVSRADFSAFSFSPTTGSAQSTRTPYLQTTTYCPSIDSSNLGVSVLGTALGCLNPLNWVGAATTLTTSKVMAQVAATYKIDNTNDLNSTTNPSMDGPNNGKSLSGTTNSGVHYGDLPGVTNILRQLSTGTSYALMLNRDNTLGAWQTTLYPQIDAIIAAGGY